MAKYIEFPVIMDQVEVLQVFNVNNVTLVRNVNDKSFGIYCGLLSYQYTSRNINTESAEKPQAWVDAINKAILTVSGPTLVSVVTPEGYILDSPIINTI